MLRNCIANLPLKVFFFIMIITVSGLVIVLIWNLVWFTLHEVIPDSNLLWQSTEEVTEYIEYIMQNVC